MERLGNLTILQRGILPLMALLVLAALGTVLLWVDQVVRTTILVQAERSSTLWIDRIEQELPALDQLLAGIPANDAQSRFILASMIGSDVFEIQFFSLEGIELFDSNGSTDWRPGDHYLSAQQVAETGQALSWIEDGDPSLGLPSKYVETYLPLFLDSDRPQGVVELYIDVSAAAGAWWKSFGLVSGAIVVLTLVVLLAPGLAFWRQHNKLRASEREYRKLSSIDPLTGLLNRRGVQAQLEALSAAHGPAARICILHIDLDHFKPINDAFGHHFGDELLCVLSERLAALARPGAVIGRVGGDEFLVCYAMRPEEQSGCTACAKSIWERLSEPVWNDSQYCHVGATIGVSSWEEGGAQTLPDALQAADIALNVAKTMGRNVVLAFDPDMKARSRLDADTVSDAAKGLREGQFTAHFQPILDLSDRRVIGFESLLRWHHPTRGLLSPEAFLTVCEAAGLSSALNRVVYKEAAVFERKLHALGRSDLKVSLNLSAPQLKSPDITIELLSVFAAHGVSPSSFRIEVVESTLIEDRSANILGNLESLKEAGFVLDLDDFGTGHAAIANLRRFPVDRIKIDKSLVRGIDTDRTQYVMTETVVSLAKKLGIEVVAEGVETLEELKVLEDLGCDGVQGFYVGKPAAMMICVQDLAEDGVKPSAVGR